MNYWSSLPRELLSAALRHLPSPYHPSFLIRLAARLFRCILPRFFKNKLSALKLSLFRALRYAVLRFLTLLDDKPPLSPKPFPDVYVSQVRNITTLPTELLSAILEQAVKIQFSEIELGLDFPDAIRPRAVTKLLRTNEQKLFQVVVDLASVHSSFYRAMHAEKVFKYMNLRFQQFERYLKDQQDFVDEQSRVHRLIYEAIPRTTERLQFLSNMLRDSVDAVAEGSLVYMLTYKYTDTTNNAILPAVTATEQAAGPTEPTNATLAPASTVPGPENAGSPPFPSPLSESRKQARWSIFITYKNVSQSFHDPTADVLLSAADLPAAYPSPFSIINMRNLPHLPFPAWYLRGLAYCTQTAAMEGRQCFQRVFNHANMDLSTLQPGTQAYVINVSISANIPPSMKKMASWVWYMRWFALAGEGNGRKELEESEQFGEVYEMDIPEAKWVMKEHTRRLCQNLAEGIW